MKKSILVLSFVVILVFSYGGKVNAADMETDTMIQNAGISMFTGDINFSEDLEDALSGVIDSRVSEDVLQNIEITSNDEEEVIYTVKYLGTICKNDKTVQSKIYSNNLEGDVYSLTAATKVKKGETTEDNVYCWIHMTWIDNLGTNNEIVSVSGGWTPNGKTLSGRQVWYGVQTVDGSFAEDLYESRFPVTNTYSYKPSKTLSGFSLRAYSWVDVEGYSGSINCAVRSSVFD